jgi:endonuclease V-like protein UPF0215 family
MIKKEIRVLGVACASSRPERASPLHIVGVVYRGNRWLEGVMRTTVPQEHADLTHAVARMTMRSPHFPQLRVIALDELITESGNYIDIEALGKETGLPVVAVLKRKALAKRCLTGRTGLQRELLKRFAGLPYRKWRMSGKTFFAYSSGLGKIDLDELLEVCASREGFPEAARVARIAASSLKQFHDETVAWAITRRPPQS